MIVFLLIVFLIGICVGLIGCYVVAFLFVGRQMFKYPLNKKTCLKHGATRISEISKKLNFPEISIKYKTKKSGFQYIITRENIRTVETEIQTQLKKQLNINLVFENTNQQEKSLHKDIDKIVFIWTKKEYTTYWMAHCKELSFPGNAC